MCLPTSEVLLFSWRPVDGLEEGWSLRGIGDERNAGVRRGEPVRPVFMGDRATGGGK